MDEHSNQINYDHNSTNNAGVPKPEAKKDIAKEDVRQNKIKFTVLGDRCAREFIYCKKVAEGLYRYRSKIFDAPVIQGWFF